MGGLQWSDGNDECTIDQTCAGQFQLVVVLRIVVDQSM